MTQAIVESTAFARAMAMIDAMVPVKDTIPILPNVLVEAGDEGVMLTGNNMDQMVRILVPAEIAGHFSAAVSARKLRTIAASVENGGQLRLEPGPHFLKIAAGRSKWALNTLPAGDFPHGGRWPICFFADPAGQFYRRRHAHSYLIAEGRNHVHRNIHHPRRT